MGKKKERRCSFCGRPESEVNNLIGGFAAYICDECVQIAYEVLKEARLNYEPQEAAVEEIPKPSQIKAFLDRYIVGQERAKKVISVAIYNHLKRIKHKNRFDDVELEKSNILMIGPTGVGKTLMAKTLAKFLNIPYAIYDATPLTEAGYVGEDVENILLRLVQNADYNLEKARYGIIYLDEFDKLSRRQDSPSLTKDVGGEGVQQALLKIVEGTVANIPPQGGRKHPEQSYIQLDTSDILFIMGGAFDGLADIIRERLGRREIGFRGEHRRVDDREILRLVQPEDLIKYGIIPEMVGRLHVIAVFDPLDVDDLVKILTEPRNALVRQYQKLFELEGVNLQFTQKALETIAEIAMKRGTGARGLRAIMEEVLNELMFQLPELKERGVARIIITDETILKHKEPIFEVREERKAGG